MVMMKAMVMVVMVMVMVVLMLVVMVMLVPMVVMVVMIEKFNYPFKEGGTVPPPFNIIPTLKVSETDSGNANNFCTSEANLKFASSLPFKTLKSPLQPHKAGVQIIKMEI